MLYSVAMGLFPFQAAPILERDKMWWSHVLCTNMQYTRLTNKMCIWGFVKPSMVMMGSPCFYRIDCWHRGRRLQAYLSNRDLIHACTESHCDICKHPPPPLPLPSVFPCLAGCRACATVCYSFRWKINYNSFTSKGSRSLQLTQIEQLRLPPPLFFFWGHVNRKNSLMPF